MTVTIKDVAAAAGVSVGTVSKVINKSGFVSDKIREKVLLAITLLNYKPNGIARSLKQSKTRLIGVIVDEISNPYTMEVVRAVEAIAADMEFNVILAAHQNDHGKEAKALRMMTEKRVDGIILLGTGCELAETNVFSSIPCVLVDQRVENLQLDRVAHDYATVSKKIINYLHENGRRNLLIVHDLLCRTVEEEKYKAAIEALNSLEFNLEKQQFLEIKSDVKEVYVTIKKQLLNEPLPDAVFAMNSIVLIGILKAVTSLGFEIPQKMMIVGIGDIDPHGFLKPQLSLVVKEKPNEVGKIAADVLFEKIESGSATEVKEFMVNPEMVENLFISTK
ncbi:LacI family DNA-binding transcriptional regulator [Bacillus songklensis]|uniref:LacI family DNA-binding transcriptional regulator n=1 Tax=Bacillus songklensis TaxID=1069116 RepID=A0ABV8B890_9BACI